MKDAFRQYFDTLPCYLTVQDREFRIIEANQRFRESFGDFAGRYCYQVYKHRSEKCEVCPVEQAFQDGECHRGEEQVRCLDGKEVSVIVEATPLRDENGRINAVMEMSTDVTKIKHLEKKLRQSQERYRLLFEEVPCYITIQDQDLNIVETNRAFQEDFGHFLGCKCYEAYKHRNEECYPCPVRETFRDGELRTHEDVVTSRRGERRNVLITTAPIRNISGEVVRVMELSANITQVRQLESQLTSLGLLVGSISHDLKGLFNALAGGMYLLDTGLQKNNQERVLKGWETIKRYIARMRNVVSDILYYAKERVPNWETLNAVEIAKEVCKMLNSRSREEGVPVACSVDPGAGTFEGDPNAIRSLLSNLVENALDACRLDKKKARRIVNVGLRGAPDHVRYEIEDNGIGMDRETREKALSLFFTSKGMQGTGLGLFIANRIVQAHGGTLELESEVDVGTRVIVKLPRKRPSQHPRQSPEEVSNGGKPKDDSGS